ncbi:flagellar biosynthetic protein FliO [Undibacterium sp. RuRC25W]|uniref:flagellar biosynthetic protein FliO n=1 Tax=Undibacterium sp. RuRC25W TaxID=3413047 RepID=UPI003BF08134
MKAVSPGIGFLQIAGALLFVLLLMFAAAWLLKRIGPVASGNKILVKVVGGVSVGNRERVLVVEVDDQWLILGVTSNNISNLGSMPKKDVPVSINQTGNGIFQDWLKRTIEKRSDAHNDIK